MKILIFSALLMTSTISYGQTSSINLLDAYQEMDCEQQNLINETLDEAELSSEDLSEVELEVSKVSDDKIKGELIIRPDVVKKYSPSQRSLLVKLGAGLMLPYGPEISAHIGKYDWEKKRYRYSVYLSLASSIPRYKSNMNAATVGVNATLFKGLYIGPIFQTLLIHQGLLIGQKNFYLTAFGGNLGYQIPVTINNRDFDVDVSGFYAVGGLGPTPQGFSYWGLGARIKIPTKKRKSLTK